MAFFVTRLDESTQCLIECETSGAFSKSDLEIKPDPEQAVIIAMSTIVKIAEVMGRNSAQLKSAGANEFDIDFGIKVDGVGSVMIAQRVDEGQFRVALRFAAAG